MKKYKEKQERNNDFLIKEFDRLYNKKNIYDIFWKVYIGFIVLTLVQIEIGMGLFSYVFLCFCLVGIPMFFYLKELSKFFKEVK